MRKVILAVALMVLGGTAVASAQEPVAPPKPDSAQAQKPGAMADTGMKKAAEVAVVDVNTATQAQLEAIPALKPYADKIIKGRPYTSIDQLEEKKILPKDVFGATKSQLKVGGY